MSTTIDERVVEMRFDNKHFESNVSTTMSTLDKLKQSLNLTGASKGLENVSAAAKNCDVGVVGRAAETVGLKFNAMYTIADQALRRITDSAINTGKRMISALTIDPVKTGFSEYETKINSIQTIMSNTASKGTTMDDVTRVLDELNTYADKTIYNFAEMTRNIGTFTAAGVGLEDSAKAIQGIANLAAASGSSSHQASTAMYQLSQALSTGTVRLMDWNSVVNAGMGGEKFQEALKATAREHGVAVDDIIKKNGSFRDSLQDGWLSADILNETLRKFTVDGAKAYAQSMVESGKYTQEQADALIKEAQAMEDAATKVKTFSQLWDTLKESAQSGWSKTWEILVGDFEEARSLLTDVSNTIGGFIERMSESRNTLLENWKAMGGRTDLIEAIRNAFHDLLDIIEPIKNAFGEVFSPITTKQLVDFTAKLRKFTEDFQISDETAINIKRTFKGLFTLVKMVGKVLVAAYTAVKPLLGFIGDLVRGFLSATAVLGDWILKIDESAERLGILDWAASGIAKILSGLIKIVKNIAKYIKQAFITGPVETFLAFVTGFQDQFNEMGHSAESLGDTIAGAFEAAGSAMANCAFFKVLKGFWTIITSIAKLAGKVVGTLVGGLADKLANADFEGIVTFLSTLSVGAIVAYVIKLVKSWKELIDGFGSFKDMAKGVIDSVTGVFNQLRDTLKSFQTSIKAQAIMTIAKAILILVASLVVLSLIPQDKLSSAISALSILFIELLIGLNTLGKIGSIDTSVHKTAGIMLVLSAAVLILAAAMKKISSLSPEELIRGFLGVTGLLIVLSGTLIALKKLLKNGAQANTLTQSVKALLPLVLALYILAAACKMLAKLSWEELARGLTGVVVLLGALFGVLVGLTNLLKNSVRAGTLVKSVLSLAILVASIAILIPPLMLLSALNWAALGRAGAGLAGILISLVGAVAILSLLKSGGLTASGSVLLLSLAINTLVPPFLILSSLKWEAIAKGALALVTVLGLIVGAVALLSLVGGGLAGAGAIVAVSAAILILTGALKVLGGMSWESIAKGLIAIAGAFAIIGVAGLLLSPLVVPILALAAAITLIGVGVLAAGVGLTAFGLGLTAVSGGLIAFAGAAVVVVKSIPVMAQAIVGLIDALITGVIKGVGNGLIALCDIIIQGGPKIGEAIKVLVLEVIDVIITCAPAIVSGMLKLMVLLLQAIADYTPQIVELVIQILVNILNSIANNLGPLIEAGTKLVGAVISGVIQALAGLDAAGLDVALLAAGKLALIMAALTAAGVLAPAALASLLAMSPVIAGLSALLAVIGLIAQKIPGLEGLIGEGGNLLQAIGTAIGKFVGGIVGGFMGGVSAQFPQIATDLSNFMTNVQDFINGAKSIDSSVLTGVGALVGAILLVTGANLLQNIANWLVGDTSMADFAVQIVELGHGLKGFSDAVAGVNPENITAAANAAKALADMTSHIPNSGGVVSWFTGDNSIAAFASDLPILGAGLKGFSDSVAGINPESMIAAATAAKTLVELTNNIPNNGGIVAWITGENSISRFGSDLIKLGEGLKGFSDKVIGINPENMTAAANAGKSLAELTNNIPNNGGIVAWITGENSVSKFSKDLIKLGEGLKGFSDKIAGINPENMTAASNAAKNLAKMTSYIPSEGGIAAWLSGETSISKFSKDLIKLGEGLKGFSDKIDGINPENVTAAATAAKNLAKMTNTIPTEGGIKAWFTGESSISKFAGKLPKLGEGLKGFSDKVAGINTENITAASKAAKSLAQMADTAPKDLGPMVNLGNKIKPFGDKLKGYFSSVGTISGESITASKNAINAIKAISGVNVGKIESASKAIGKLTETLKKTAGINSNTTAGFVKAISNLGKVSVDGFTKSFSKLNQQMGKIGKDAVNAFIKAVKDKRSAVTEAGKGMSDAFAKGTSSNSKTVQSSFTTLISKVLTTIRDKRSSFNSAGSYLVGGLSAGISAKAPSVLSRARALANSIATVMRAALKINSPSRVAYEIGDFFGMGLVKALNDYSSIVYDTGSELGSSAKNGLGDAISKIRKFIDSDIDSQPVIRPVLDLSDVESNAGIISSLIGGSSVGVMANVGAISSSMGRNGQNGGNADVISAIDKLRKDLGKVQSNTYQINGITYDDGSNLSEAIKELIRAAKIERRT